MRVVTCSLLLFLISVPSLQADTQYFMLMFGSQQEDPEPEHSHTWATFVEVTWLDGCRTIPQLRSFTISWFPKSLVIRLPALRSEPGANFGLHFTIEHVLSNKERVSMWGAYQIQKELFCLAKEQLDLLLSGKVRYKAIDTGHFSDRVSNCIHAVSHTIHERRVRVLTPGWGETASWIVLWRLRRYIIDRDRTHPWIGSALGLDAYPIVYREFGAPRSGNYRRFLSRALCRDRDTTTSFGPPAR